MSGTGDYILGMVGLALIAVSMAIAGRDRPPRRAPGLDRRSGPPRRRHPRDRRSSSPISELLGLFGLLDGLLLVIAC